jgi:hypothetical protein
VGQQPSSKTEIQGGQQFLPGFDGLGPKPSNKSIIGAALAEDVACAESEEGDERASSVAIGDLSF